MLKTSNFFFIFEDTEEVGFLAGELVFRPGTRSSAFLGLGTPRTMIITQSRRLRPAILAVAGVRGSRTAGGVRN